MMLPHDARPVPAEPRASRNTPGLDAQNHFLISACGGPLVHRMRFRPPSRHVLPTPCADTRRLGPHPRDSDVSLRNSTLIPQDGLEQMRRDTWPDNPGHHPQRARGAVAPYVLAPSVEERRADVALIARYAVAAGLALTSLTFADAAKPPHIGERRGWRAARQYAEQGYAHGFVVIARLALTTDPAEYAALLEDLFAHRLFVTFLPTENERRHVTSPSVPAAIQGAGTEGGSTPSAGLPPTSHTARHRAPTSPGTATRPVC